MSEENGRTDLTWRELLDEGGARLSEAGVPDAGTDAWYLMEAAFGIDRVHYYLDQNRPIHAERLEKGYGRYQEMLQKRAERIPLQQILGMQDFMGMTFSVDENVLIPRQDTETLVERVLRDYPEKDLKLFGYVYRIRLYRDQPCRAWRLPEHDGGGYFRGGAARGKEKCETSLFDSEGNCAVRIVSGIGGSVVHPPENVAGKGTAPAGRDRGTQPDTFAEQSVSGGGGGCHVRCDCVESAVYPIGGDRRSGTGGTRP